MRHTFSFSLPQQHRSLVVLNFSMMAKKARIQLRLNDNSERSSQRLLAIIFGFLDFDFLDGRKRENSELPVCFVPSRSTTTLAPDESQGGSLRTTRLFRLFQKHSYTWLCQLTLRMDEKWTGTSNWRSQISITALCRIFVCFRSHSSALCGSHPRYARGQKSLIHNCRELPPKTPEWRASRASLEAPINPLLLCGELCARPVESEFSGCLREQGRTP